MTNREAISILVNMIKPPIIRNDGKSQAHLLALEAIQKAVVALEAEPTKHGHWIWKDHYLVCSECGKENDRKNYCPNCGARMDGGENGTD